MFKLASLLLQHVLDETRKNEHVYEIYLHVQTSNEEVRIKLHYSEWYWITVYAYTYF